MNMLRSNRVKFSVIAMAAALILGIVGAAVAMATWDGGYEEATSLESLQSARGVVADYVETVQPPPTGKRDWMVSGEWTLDCGDLACIDDEDNLDNIEFDTAFAMMIASKRSIQSGQGDHSHGHQFSDFEAVSSSVSGGTLTIVGTITGSGPIKDVGITIRLVKSSSGHFTSFFKLNDGLPGNPAVIVTEIGGAVVESN